MATKPLAPARAAGAVAHRNGRKGTKLLLVHRPKYGDWTLPKGHLEDGETYEEAAVRELAEEAGVAGDLGALVGSIGYRVRRRPKVVRYWLMEADRAEFKPNSEVDEVAWVSPKKAMLLSSYDDDRSVIATAVDRLRRPRSASIHLVRHAEAGTRAGWKGSDLKRPLSSEGRRQTRVINRRLLQTTLTDIFTSPYVRCTQSVAGLGHALDLSVRVDQALAEHEPIDGALDLLTRLEGTSSVLCTHGDIVSGIVETLAADGVELDGDLEWKKGSVWEVDLRKGRVKRARYVPPPL